MHNSKRKKKTPRAPQPKARDEPKRRMYPFLFCHRCGAAIVDGQLCERCGLRERRSE